MRATLIAIMAAMLLAACGRDDNQQSKAEAEAATKPALSPDSLRILYRQFHAARTDSMPAYQPRGEGRLYPVDEAPLDTGFYVFREQLRQAVGRRDVFSLLDATAKDISISFGEENGFAKFVSMWGLDSKQPDTLEIWGILERILSGGGAFSEGRKSFDAPYVYATWPEKYEPFDYGAITGAGVRLRAQPSLNSRILKTISYDIILVLNVGEEEEIDGERYPWVEAETLDGTQGYVWGKFVGYPVGYRAGFQRQDGNAWRMSYLVTGD